MTRRNDNRKTANGAVSETGTAGVESAIIHCDDTADNAGN